ncbi:dihydrodipicolinate synthase family protein [Phytoactinopolyspora limicola]|uniref:dihydrodipicolinate synthase family protein n=1 Tax=Phytoactinopolyspora limicola TaxID=2715536 RepID=UPI0014072B3A|nr:dihydrodipicolinate synthase family protein [Phytoactinopolyspora limicola]
MSGGRAILRGITIPMVTPMSAPGRPDAEAGAELLAALHAAGADALMLLGSNGEGPLLPTSALGDFVTDATARWRALGGGPVLVNVTAAGTDEALARASVVAPATPDALVLSPPIYFHHREDEIVAHYAATAALGVPVIVYNAPRYSNPITPAVFDALLAMDHVVGLKDSSGDAAWFAAAVAAAREHRPEFGISQGAEGQLLAGLRAGADGIVPGIANIAPAVAVALFRAWLTSASPESAEPATVDADQPERWQAIIDRLCGVHTIRPGVPTIKEILSWGGLCPPHVAAPLQPCTDDERTALRSYLEPLASHLTSPTLTSPTPHLAHPPPR